MINEDEPKYAFDGIGKDKNFGDYPVEKREKMKRKDIKEFLENYECRASGKHMLNGGYAELDIKRIERKKDYIVVYAITTLGDCFGQPKKEVYDDCKYYLHKDKLGLLSKDDFKRMGIKEER